MKKYLLLLIPFVFTITAYSQNGYSSVFLRVTDSATFVNSANTTAKHAAGYADIWYSVSSGLFWEWNAATSTYVIMGSRSGAFWKNTGTTAVSAPYIEDASGGEIGIVSVGASSNSSITMNGVAGTTDISARSEIGLGVFNGTTSARIEVRPGIFEIQDAELQIDTDPGTSGDVLTSQGSGSPPIWAPPSGGGGATAAGATGNVQYKSAGGGLQAEAALTYDSATNTQTVANVTHGTATALTDGGTITITGSKHTLTSTQATITWTLSQTGDFQTTDIILNAASTTWTFPVGALCVSDGVASGNNTAALSGVSGDHYIMSVYKNGTDYRVAIKNFGQ